MTDTVGPVEAALVALAGERYGTYMFSWGEVMAEARKIDAQMAALTEALEAVERWFTPRRELVEPYEELLVAVREALRSVKEEG